MPANYQMLALLVHCSVFFQGFLQDLFSGVIGSPLQLQLFPWNFQGVVLLWDELYLLL